jgi:hypothetical protein
MPNAVGARGLLAEAESRRDVVLLVRALTAVLDAADRTGDPAVARRLGLPPDSLIDFDAGVQYAADLAVAILRTSASGVAHHGR